MRRMNARYPNIALAGLLFVIIILTYKCWTLTSLDDDLRHEMEKLQTEIKISGMRQERCDNKNQQLQENIHALEDKKESIKLEVENKEIKLHEVENAVKNYEQEINNFKTILQKNENEIKDLRQQIEEKDSRIEDLTSDSQHILSMKNDAEDALSERDSVISNLKMEIEQMKKDLTIQLRSKMLSEHSSGHPKILLENEAQSLHPASLNLLSKHSIRTVPVGLQGMKFHPGMQILPRQKSNAKRRKPKFSVSDIGKNLNVDNANKLEAQDLSKKEKEKVNEAVSSDVLEKPNVKNQEANNNLLHQETQVEETKGNVPPEIHFNNEKNVLPQPLNQENLDQAVDDEGKAVEDPSDDQDEEGKEIKHDLENNNAEVYDNYDDDKVENPALMKVENNIGEPKGIGAAEVSNNVKQNAVQDDVNLVDDIDQRANERLYEADFDSKIRNLAKL